METGSGLCTMCTTSPCVVFCLCGVDPVFLCNGCMHGHSLQAKSIIHDFSAISDLQYAAQLTFPVYKQRKVAIAQAIILAEALQKQESEDYAKIRYDFNDLFQKINQLIDNLHETVNRTLYEMRTILENSLHSDHNSDLVDYLLAHGQRLLSTGASLFDVPVLTTLLNSTISVESTVTSFATTDFQEYILSRLLDAERLASLVSTYGESAQDRYCPVVMGNILRKYYAGDSGRLGLTELTMAPAVDNETAYTFLGNGNIFCCGGSEHSDVSYILGASNAQVTVLPRLVSGRSCPGLIAMDDAPYVFGGSGEAGLLISGERFSGMEKWEELDAKMLRPRGAFTPCRLGKSIYLPGGLACNTIEVFDPIRIHFRQLSVTLPVESKSISYISNNKLCVLLRSSLCTIDLTNETRESKKTSNNFEIWSPSTPVIIGAKVVFWSKEDSGMVGLFRRIGGRRDGICFSLNAETREFKEEERFEYASP